MADKESSAAKEPSADEKLVKQAADENDRGYQGYRPDPTPHFHYTVAGVLAEKPTPETDDKLAAKAAELQTLDQEA